MKQKYAGFWRRFAAAFIDGIKMVMGINIGNYPFDWLFGNDLGSQKTNLAR